MLTSETSPQLTNHVTCVHAPLSPSPLHLSTSTSPPRCLSSHHLQSIRHLPWFSLHFPLKFHRRTQSAPSNPFLVAQDPRWPKLQMLAALNNRQVHVSHLTPCRARRLWDQSSWRDEFCFGVLFTRFRMFFCFLFGLRPFSPFCFCFAPARVACFVCSI